jgi:protein TonB
MPSRRLFLICTVLSVLFHLLVLWIAYRFPATARKPEKVMVVDLADLPRSTDFLPPKPGILKEERKRPIPAPPPPRAQKRQIPLRDQILEGRVPDLPVNPNLPPEKIFPPSPPEKEPSGKPNAPPAAAKAPSSTAEKKAAAPAQPAPGSAAEKTASPPPEPAKSLRDLTPSLGQMVMARREPSGGRGRNATPGSSVGTGGKPSPREGVTEEGGGGFHLTPLNAPEVQYISYFASIKRKIELVWQYPYEAAIAGIQGDLMIDFVIGRNGRLESLHLIRSSGHKILDDEAIRSIRTAAPFDPIPAQYDIPRLEIRGQFVYTNGGALGIR